MSSSAAEAIVETLALAGVRRFYTVPGESFLGVIEAVDRHPELRLVSTRHESGAGFMADADAKLSGVPAAVMATRAVGAANLSVAVHTARQDSTPMLVCLGQAETDVIGREAFQEVDLPALYRELTVWGATMHRADRAVELTAEAVRQATHGRLGPALLALPTDLLDQPAGSTKPYAPVSPPRPAPSEADVDAVGRLLATARQPVMIVGGGATQANTTALAEHLGLGVYTAFRRQDAFPNTHPSYLGHLSIGAPESLLAPLREADLVLVLGSRLSEITTQRYTLPEPEQRLVVCDIDADGIGAHRRVDHALLADACLAVDALLSATPPRTRSWEQAHRRYLEASEPQPAPSDAGVHPDAVLAAMRRVLPENTILTNDAGNFSTFCHSRWRFQRPGTQLGPTSGAMGYAVPAAVGAALARPDQPVVGLVGDGGFLMTGFEIETAVRERADITVVVFQNEMYGTIAMHQARSTRNLAGVGITGVDIAAVAEALGAQSATVSAPADLEGALNDAMRTPGPSVLAVRTDPDVLTPRARLSTLLEGTRS
jgi:acetolactate synthase-1/2/3 large subunit